MADNVIQVVLKTLVEGEDDLKSYQSQFDQFGTTVGKVAQDFRSSSDLIAKAQAKLQQAFDSGATSIEEVEKAFRKIEEFGKVKFKGSLEPSEIQALNLYKESLEGVGDAARTTGSQLDDYKAFATALTQSLSEGVSTLQDSSEGLDKFSLTSEKASEVIEKLRENLDNFEASLQQSSIDKTTDLYRKYEETISAAREELERFAASQGVTTKGTTAVEGFLPDKSEMVSAASTLGKSVMSQFLEAASDTLVEQPLDRMLTRWAEQAGAAGPLIAEIQKSVTPALKTALSNLAQDIPESGLWSAIKRAIMLPEGEQDSIRGSFSDFGKAVAKAFLEEAANEFVAKPLSSMIGNWIKESGTEHGLGGAIFEKMKGMLGFGGGGQEPPELPKPRWWMTEGEFESLRSIATAERELVQSGTAYAQSIKSITNAQQQYQEESKKTAQSSELVLTSWQSLGLGIVALNQAFQLLDRIFGPINAQFDRSIQVASNLEAATLRLGGSLRAFGKSIPTYELVEFANEMERTWGIADTGVLEVAKLLAEFTDLDNEALKEATKSIVVLSESMGVSAVSAARQFAYVLEGRINTIRNLVVTIDDATAATDRYGAVMEQMRPRVEAAESTTQSYQRIQKILNQELDNFREKVGDAFIKQLKDVNLVLIDIVRNLTKWAEKNPEVVVAIAALTKTVDLLSRALFILAAYRLAQLPAALEAAKVAAIAFATHPAGIAIIAVSLVAASGAIETFITQLRDLAASRDPKAASELIERLNRDLQQLERTAPGNVAAIQGYRNRIAALKQMIKVDQDAARAAGMAAAAIGGMAEESTTIKPGRIESERLERAEREIKDFVANAQASLVKMRADVAAEGLRATYEATGDLTALQRSFAVAQQGIVASSAANLEQQIRKMGESLKLTPKQMEALSGPLVNLSDQQKSLQLQQLSIQQQTALRGIREQARATEISQLKSLEEDARLVLDLERSRLNILKEQQEPLNIQDEQLKRVQAAEATLIDITIANRQREIEQIGQVISEENLRGDKLTRAQLSQQALTFEIERQKQRLQELNAELDKSSKLQEKRNLRVASEQEIAYEQEYIQAINQRLQKEQQVTTSIWEQIRALRQQIKIAGIGSEQKRRLEEITFQYEEMRRRLRELIADMPELEKTGSQAARAIAEAFRLIDEAEQAAKNQLDTFSKVAQSISDAFVNSMDRAFDDLLTGTESFGEKLKGLLESLGQTILKTILHELISVQIKNTMDEIINSFIKGKGWSGLLDVLTGLFTGNAPAKASTTTAGQAAGAAEKAVESAAQLVAMQTFTISLGTATIAIDTAAANLSFSLGVAAEAAKAFAAAAGSSAGSSGGLGFFGAIGEWFSGWGGGGAVAAHGGMLIIPKGFAKPFRGGGVVQGPTLGVLGEEGPEIVARMKPATQRNTSFDEPKVQVIIEGDIIPKRPQMTEEDVIRVVISNGERTLSSGIGGMVRNIIKRNR